MPTPSEMRKRIAKNKGVPDEEQPGSDRKFILITADGSGLGFADQEVRRNGSEVIVALQPTKAIDDDKQENWDIQGEGLFPTTTLDQLFKDREEYRDYFWVFDANHNEDIGEKLKSEGFKTFNGTKFQDTLEHDREKGLAFAESVGLHSPPHHEFSSPEDGVAFLEANPLKAFVVKPNDSDDSALTQTFREEDEDFEANIAAQKFIKAMNLNDYILQERVKGVEVNTEIFFSHGKPVLAQANLECKRRHNTDLGCATGCAMDVCWVVDIKSPLVQKTAGLFTKVLAEMDYTGFADTNVIISDENQIWFLEFCFRTGYNAHPNFFMTLAEKTYLQTIADLIDEVPVAAKKGFGASITLFTDKPRLGLPLHVHKPIIPFFHLFDGYKDPDSDHPGDYLTGGFANEIGIVTAHNYTIETAFQDALANVNKVKYVNKDHRTDGDRTDFPTSPVRRYQALLALGLI